MIALKKVLIAFGFTLIIVGNASGSFVWDQMADFGGGVRDLPFAFSIGSYGYAGGGRSPADQNDFWQYDPSTNSWTQMADYAGTGRYGLVGFSIGNFGYAGTGWSGPGTAATQHKDFWQYNPLNNSWTQKTDFGGPERYGAVALVIGDKGYVGLGYTPYKNDFWEYDPANDSWVQKTDFPGAPRLTSIGFGIANKGYVGTGISATAHYNDLYEFDPANNSWTQKSNMPGLVRRNAVAFAIGNFGYVGMGFNDTTFLTDFSQYDPISDHWTIVASIGGIPRYAAFAFMLDNYGYVGGGSYYISDPIRTNDFWRFGDCDGTPVGMVPGPSHHNSVSMAVSSEYRKGIILDYDMGDERNAKFVFYNSLGQQILSVNLLSNKNKMTLSIPLSSEIYFYSVTSDERKLASGKVIVN